MLRQIGKLRGEYGENPHNLTNTSETARQCREER